MVLGKCFAIAPVKMPDSIVSLISWKTLIHLISEWMRKTLPFTERIIVQFKLRRITTITYSFSPRAEYVKDCCFR